MQPDAWFVENIKNAGQARTDLRGEPDPLRFAARKCPALAIEREIIQPHLHEKLQARIDLPDHLGNDVPLLVTQREPPDILAPPRRSSAR